MLFPANVLASAEIKGHVKVDREMMAHPSECLFKVEPRKMQDFFSKTSRLSVENSLQQDRHLISVGAFIYFFILASIKALLFTYATFKECFLAFC